jgi:hypothetical protein
MLRCQAGATREAILERQNPARSARAGRAEKRIGGAARSFFGSSRRLEPRDFSLQDRNALANLLRGKIVKALSDLVSRRLLARRHAKNLVVLLRHCKRISYRQE